MDTPKRHCFSVIRMSQDELWQLCESPETICKLCISLCVFAHYSKKQVYGSHLILQGAPDHRKVRTIGIKEYQQNLVNRRTQTQNFPTQYWCTRDRLSAGIEGPFALKVARTSLLLLASPPRSRLRN